MTTENKTTEFKTLVESAMTFATASAILADAKKTAEEARERMVPILRANAKADWKKELSPVIKSVLSGLGLNVAQVKSWHDTFKTCFEYKILPTDSNADRLRKATTWTNWSGSKIPNSYKAPNTKAQKPEPTVSQSVASQPVASAPSEPVKPAPTVKGSPSVSKPVINEDAMTPFDVWATYFDRFIEHGVTTHYIQTLAGILGTDSKSLALAMVTAKKDLVAKAESALNKK